MEVARGKRSKRPRLSSFFGYAASMSSSGREDYEEGKEDSGALSSATVSAEKEEEEAMANCLILLAQGHGSTQLERRDDGSGFSIYECKTCNRAFPSFQSLGGLRVGHKRPKQTAMGEEKKAFSFIEPVEFNKNGYTHPSPSKGSSINKGKKIHECSICGLEFASGQALGGHMRRHRAVSRGGSCSYASQESVAGMEIKQRNILQLDLNLPAPEEDFRESKFQFIDVNSQSLVFSAPALVDCHH